jgi:hypothetical protein
VVKNRHVTAGSGLVIDRAAVISAVGPIRVDTSSDSAFSSDAVLIRATWRIGWNVVTPGVFVLNAARNPAANLSLIWFTVASSVVHSAIMAVQSFSDDHMGHLWGDVPALLLVAVVLSVLVLSSGLKQSAAAPSSAR